MPDLEITFCDETAFGFGWIAGEPPGYGRASHALRADGNVWIVDPVDGPGVVERVRALGEPAAVLQLLDRHERDCAALAARLDVPHRRLPFDGVPGSPFETIRVLDVRGWREVALWWRDERALVCTEALGTSDYFRAPGERIAVHPFLRLRPPRGLRDMARYLAPRHVLVGHGEGIHGDDVAADVAAAVGGARRNAPSWLVHQIRRRRR